MVGDFDWFAPEAMAEYFKQLYARVTTFDKPQVKSLLYTPNMAFEEATHEFRLIDDSTTSVIINWENKNVISLIEQLRSEGVSYPLMKKLAQYSVNVRKQDLQKLMEAGALEEITEGVLFVRYANFYDEYIGLITDNHWIEESLIV